MSKIITSLFFFTFYFNLTVYASIEQKKKAPKVFVQKLMERDIFEHATYVGKISPQRILTVYSPIDGIVRRENLFEGSAVKAGQVVLSVTQNIIGLKVLPAKIKAPINGIVLQIGPMDNILVRKNTPLFSVFDPSKLKMELNLASSDVNHLKIGSVLNVKLQGQVLTGKIQSISPYIDPATGTQKAQLMLNNADKKISFAPGGLGEASFKYNFRKGFLIDKKYLSQKGKKQFIRIVGKDSKAKNIEVTLGSEVKDEVEVLAKLKQGDQMITKSSVGQLYDGQIVEVVEQYKNETKKESIE